MLLAEDLLLLVLDAQTGQSRVNDFTPVLAGAVLIELCDRGLVDVDKPVRGRIVIHPAEPPTHPLLVTALNKVKAKAGRRPRDVIRPLGKGLLAQLTDSLVDADMVRRKEHRVLRLFPVTRLPVLDVGYQTSLREHVRAVLDGAMPDEHLCTLISLLDTVNAVTRVVDVSNERAARYRATEIAKSERQASALAEAVQAAVTRSGP